MVKWTYRFLSRRQHVFKFEAIILDFIKNKSQRMDTRKRRLEIFQQLKRELEKLLADPVERIVLEDFDYLLWVESKIKGKPFAELVLERAKNLT
jgi:lantibiotic modifying enzyme